MKESDTRRFFRNRLRLGFCFDEDEDEVVDAADDVDFS